MTKRTGMHAVKGLRNRLAQRRALRIIDDHRCPCQRLKNNPMQANRATKRENRGDATGIAEHVARLIAALFDVNHCGEAAAPIKKACANFSADTNSHRNDRDLGFTESAARSRCGFHHRCFSLGRAVTTPRAREGMQSYRSTCGPTREDGCISPSLHVSGNWRISADLLCRTVMQLASHWAS
jgi:hypothetical protein